MIVKKYWKKLLKGERVPIYERKSQRKNGEIFTSEISITPIQNTDGEILYLQAILRDISERKQFQLELERQRIFLQTIIDTDPNFIWVKDKDLRYVLVNQAVANRLNSTVDYIIGKTDAEIQHSKQNFQVFLERDQQIFDTLESQHTPEELLYDGDGTAFWRMSTKLPLIFPDGTKYILGVGIDITELKETEEALRRSESHLKEAQALANLGNFEFDLQTDEVIWSDEVYRIFDVPLGTKINLQVYENLLLPEDFRRIMLLVRNTINTKSPYQLEHQIRFDDGTLKYVYAIGRPIIDENDNVVKIFGTVQDITQRKLVEQQMQKTLAKERELVELQSRFVTMVSHEFRTPLSTILFATETLQKHFDKLNDASRQKRFSHILNNIELMNNLLEDILTIGSMEENKLQIHTEMFDFYEFVLQIVKQLRQIYASHDIVIDVISEEMLISADKKLLRQGITNLITNATKYSDKGSTITVALQNDLAEYRLQISDQGIGIPEYELETIFEPFQRAKNVGNIGGTGLGLAITKRAIELHNGTIQVESRLSEGTTFLMTLPKNKLVEMIND